MTIFNENLTIHLNPHSKQFSLDSLCDWPWIILYLEKMQMKFTVVDAIVYVLLSLIYGTAFAAVQEAQEYYNPCVLIAYRMLFGFGTCVIIFIFRLIVQVDYRPIAKAHFLAGIVPIIHLAIGGVLFHGITQCMCSIALQWLPSAAAQITQPISTATASIMSHFIFTDERFNIHKFISLVCALAGVVLNAIPSFLHSGSSDETKNVTIGYVVLILGVIVQGVGMVYMKWKSPNTDVTVSAMIQVGASAVLCFIWSLIYDSPSTIANQSVDSPPIAWLWLLLVGVLATGLAGHGYVFLVNNIGATGASFITFGQIFVGIVVGVAFMKEWSGYRWWEIFMCVVGVLFLAGAIATGFIGGKDQLFQESESSSSEKVEEKKEEKPKSPPQTTPSIKLPPPEEPSESVVEKIDEHIAEL